MKYLRFRRERLAQWPGCYQKVALACGWLQQEICSQPQLARVEFDQVDHLKSLISNPFVLLQAPRSKPVTFEAPYRGWP